MTDAPAFDPFAALAVAKAKTVSRTTEKTLAELSQSAAELKDEEIQSVAEKFATLATVAGVGAQGREIAGAAHKERKKDFSLFLQGLTTGQGSPWLAPEARNPSARAGTPARVAILREKELTLCDREENPLETVARVLREFEPGADEKADPTLAVARVNQATFDERAAFLEYECGLSRPDAEYRARRELRFGSAAPAPTQTRLPDRDGLTLWLAGFDRLKLHDRPCYGYREGQWPRVYARARSFLDNFGEQAAALGWTAPRLFGVHPEAGIGRVDHCGALVLPIGGPVLAITATEISFSHLTHRTKLGQPDGTPLWLATSATGGC